MEHIPEGCIWDLDRTLMLAINGGWGAVWDGFWWLVSQPWVWLPLFVATVWTMCRQLGTRRMWVAMGLVILGLALADQTANFFKRNTPKYRPTHTQLMWDGAPYSEQIHTTHNLFTGREYRGGNFGTVSGHAATAMVIALTAAGIIRRRWYSFAAGAYVALTCMSRLYLGVHFPLDILFGLTAGTLLGLAMLRLWRATMKIMNHES
ncbi:MAG: phosphatase PAP2 family protein [Alistipes sp.]|jgi:undecaprenyl-diphosphatase|nr:phosphatase PAP2 family protein [Alistipes sp.]